MFRLEERHFKLIFVSNGCLTATSLDLTGLGIMNLSIHTSRS